MPQGRHSRRHNSAPYILGGAFALALVVFLFYQLITVLVTVDGREHRVHLGTKVAELTRGGAPGDLVAAGDRKVLKPGGGDKGYIVIDGERVDVGTRIWAAGEVRTVNGSDVVEPVKRRSEKIEPPLKYEGEGPMETVISSGTPGLRSVYYGTMSNQVVKVDTSTPATPKVVQRSRPNEGAKVVTLTFDDGPWPGQTERILAILEEYDVKATFFMLGQQAKAHPDIARRVAEAGMEVANHSINHPNLKKLSEEGVRKQVVGAQEMIAKASGVTPTYFRPPGGNYNATVKSVLRSEGLELVQWGVDTEDWKRPGSGTIADRAVERASPGAVILMHDGGGERSQTIAALPEIIRRLKAKGYTFVTLGYLPSLPGEMG